MAGDPVVHVIDDDDAARDSLAFLLKTAEFSVSTYESAEVFLNALPSIEAGCVVTDVRMPRMDGLALLRHLKDQQVKLPVIVITGQGDFSIAFEAIKAGAVDFIEKPYDHETLLGAVRSALDGHAADSMLGEAREEIQERLATLSPIERQVLNGLVGGQLNKAIASTLEISPRTFDVHRANVMAKMKAKRLSHLVRMMLPTAS